MKSGSNSAPSKKLLARDTTALKQFSYFSFLLFSCFAAAVAYTTHSYWSTAFIGAIAVFPFCVYGIAYYLGPRAR